MSDEKITIEASKFRGWLCDLQEAQKAQVDFNHDHEMMLRAAFDERSRLIDRVVKSMDEEVPF